MTAHELIRAAGAARGDEEEVARLAAAFFSASADEPGDAEAREAALEELVTALWEGFGRLDRPLLRVLTGLEVKARREKGGCGDSLPMLCFMLHQLGVKEDVFLIYDAKHANFDTGCMLDLDLFTMGHGREEMRRFVADALSAEPARRADYPHLQETLEAAFDNPQFESPEAFRQAMRSHFGD
jgi:hypothetical protein